MELDLNALSREQLLAIIQKLAGEPSGGQTAEPAPPPPQFKVGDAVLVDFQFGRRVEEVIPGRPHMYRISQIEVSDRFNLWRQVWNPLFDESRLKPLGHIAAPTAPVIQWQGLVGDKSWFLGALPNGWLSLYESWQPKWITDTNFRPVTVTESRIG